MKSFDIQTRIRYSETDQMGVVYHGNYAAFLEIGRTEWLRKKGLSYKELEKNGVMLPVVSLTMNYKKPALYDDLITIKTFFKSQSGAKIEFEYEIFNENGELLTTAYSLLVFVNKNTGRPMSPPDYVKNKIAL